MDARLLTLGSLDRAPRGARRNGGQLVLEALVARRGAETGAFDQWKLREYIRALTKAYGYRKDFRGKNPPWLVPYVPLPFAAEMVDYFRSRASYWLGSDKPDPAKQPGFIKKWIARASEIVGRIERGRVIEANAESLEDAPAAVAAKAPILFAASVPAGQPHSKVLKAQATWDLVDALIRLAIHFDALAGQPSKLEIFEEAVKESADELAESALDVAQGLVALPARLTHFAPTALKWAALAAVGLGVAYAVSR